MKRRTRACCFGGRFMHGGCLPDPPVRRLVHAPLAGSAGSEAVPAVVGPAELRHRRAKDRGHVPRFAPLRCGSRRCCPARCGERKRKMAAGRACRLSGPRAGSGRGKEEPCASSLPSARPSQCWGHHSRRVDRVRVRRAQARGGAVSQGAAPHQPPDLSPDHRPR